MIELIAAIPSYAVFSETDFSHLNAVYLGQPYCLKVKGNFIVDLASLALAIKELHQKDKKAYLVTPALVFEPDLSLVKKAVQKAVSLGIDAIEVQDVGLFSWLRRTFPEVKIHLGQMVNVYNLPTAERYYELGVSRIMPAPELTFNELKEVAKHPSLEYEFPVHGRLSLGMAFSCLLTRKLPGEERLACQQNCAQEYYLDFGNWSMRCVGTSLVTAEEWCLLEHLDKVLSLKPKALRLETYFDNGQKISQLGKVYKEAVNLVSSGQTITPLLVKQLQSVAPKLCNGWFLGLSGRQYAGASQEVKVSHVTS